MNNPFCGYFDSQVSGLGVEPPSEAQPDSRVKWPATICTYYGQRATTVPSDSSCGSALYDANGDVWGFFWFMTEESGCEDVTCAAELLCIVCGTGFTIP